MIHTMYKQQILQFYFFYVFWCVFFLMGDAAKRGCINNHYIITCPQGFKHKAHLDITFLLSVFFVPNDYYLFHNYFSKWLCHFILWNVLIILLYFLLTS